MDRDIMRISIAAMAFAARHGLLLHGNSYTPPPGSRQLTESDQRAIADAQAKRERRAARATNVTEDV